MLAAALSLGLALRLNDLDRVGFETDEGHSAWIAALPIPDLPGILLHDSAPPLYYVLLHFWQILFDSDAGVRMLSVALGAAAVPAAYLAGRHLLDARSAHVAALFMAVSPFHVRFSQIGKNNVLFYLLVLAAFVLLLGACRGPFRWKRWVGFSLALAALLYTHALAAFFIATLGIVFLLWAERPIRERLRPWLAAHAGAALLFLPWAGLAFQQAGAVAQGFWAERPGLSAPLLTWARFLLIRPPALAELRANSEVLRRAAEAAPFLGPVMEAIPRWGWWVPPMIACVLAAATLVVSGRGRLALLLASLLVAPVAGVWVVSRLVASVYLDRVLMPSLIALPILLAAPFAARAGAVPAPAGAPPARGRRGPRVLRVAAKAASAICFPLIAFSGWHFTETRRVAEWREAALTVGERARDGDALVFDAHFGQILFDRYLGEEAGRFARYGLPVGWYDERPPTVARYVLSDPDLAPLREAAGRHPALWLVRAHTALHDPRDLARAWCEENLTAVERHGFLGVEVVRYETARPAAPSAG